MVSSKQCFKCGKVKVLSDFYKHPMMADGHVNKCKECNKLDNSLNRCKRVEYYRAYDSDRAKRKHRAEAAAEISALWRGQDPRIMQCHNAVTRAVKSGRLVRQPCERCESVKSLAHHESYNKPLDVVWLCQPCHKARHSEMKRMGVDPLA